MCKALIYSKYHLPSTHTFNTLAPQLPHPHPHPLQPPIYPHLPRYYSDWLMFVLKLQLLLLLLPFPLPLFVFNFCLMLILWHFVGVDVIVVVFAAFPLKCTCFVAVAQVPMHSINMPVYTDGRLDARMDGWSDRRTNIKAFCRHVHFFNVCYLWNW